jgi:hypothetical protein
MLADALRARIFFSNRTYYLSYKDFYALKDLYDFLSNKNALADNPVFVTHLDGKTYCYMSANYGVFRLGIDDNNDGKIYFSDAFPAGSRIMHNCDGEERIPLISFGFGNLMVEEDEHLLHIKRDSNYVIPIVRGRSINIVNIEIENRNNCQFVKNIYVQYGLYGKIYRIKGLDSWPIDRIWFYVEYDNRYKDLMQAISLRSVASIFPPQYYYALLLCLDEFCVYEGIYDGELQLYHELFLEEEEHRFHVRRVPPSWKEVKLPPIF